MIETKRCLACTLAALGVPKPLARGAAALPNTVYARATAITGIPTPLSRMRIPGLIASGRQRFLEFMGKVDHVVAVSQWVRDVLKRNTVPVAKITLSRQGIDAAAQAPRPKMREPTEPLKIAYFGRIDQGKGPDLLARALKMIPEAFVQVDIFAIRQGAGPNQVYDWLVVQAQQDTRLKLRTAVAPEKVGSVMADYDLIAVPSRLLETGPLVALEAFAAGVPVLGANLGGIAEVVRDGVDGILVAPDDAAAWAATIKRLANNRHVLDALRSCIVPPRTMDAAATDMATLYARILSRQLQ
jgi:glycosyltransferase involved in cell wall biosynthesis